VSPWDLVAAIVDERSLKTAAELRAWARSTHRKLTPAVVVRACATRRARFEVVLALTLGMVKRAHKDARGRVHARAHDYCRVGEGDVILNLREPALCAALALWMHQSRLVP
jgi:hypothetical protein